jgi:hypothetical protein
MAEATAASIFNYESVEGGVKIAQLKDAAALKAYLNPSSLSLSMRAATPIPNNQTLVFNKIGDKAVVSFAADAFKGTATLAAAGVKAIKLPPTLKEIASDIFTGVTGLEAILVPDTIVGSVKTQIDNAIAAAPGLTKVDVKGDNTAIAGLWIGPTVIDESLIFVFDAEDNTVTGEFGRSLGTYSLNGNVLTLNQTITGTALVAGNTLTLSGFSGVGPGTDGTDTNISAINATYSRGGQLNVNNGHPQITDDGKFTVWVRDASGASAWSGSALSLDTFGTFNRGANGKGIYTPGVNIVAATPGEPSAYGYGNVAPLEWLRGSRTGSYDVFIKTSHGHGEFGSFSGRYKNNVQFTDGVANITIPSDWSGWTSATVN